MINEMYVKQLITDRNQFSLLLSAPFAEGKYMSVLVR